MLSSLRGSGPLRRLPQATLPRRHFSRSARWLESKPSSTSAAAEDAQTPPAQPSPLRDDTDAQSAGASASRTTAEPGTSSNGSVDIAAAQERLRAWSENSAIAIRKRADEFTASALSTFAQLGGHLNRVTGYDEIEALKGRVVEQEALISIARQRAREAKKAHEEAVIQRSNSQREVNELLQRKSSWTDADVVRFTSLVREDHSFEQNEARTKAEAALAEEQVEKEFSELMQSILARYHEEQVWSDKIRSASTYGSLAALGLNLVVFILAIVIVEPWKRRRLAQTFEKKIEELSVQNRDMIEGGMKDLSRHFETQEQFLSHIAAMAAALPTPSAAATVTGSTEELEATIDEISKSALSTEGARTSGDRTVVTVAAATAVLHLLVYEHELMATSDIPMDSESPWDESPLDAKHNEHAQWTKLENDFTNAGYREGITAGKESALQEGFDAGFAQDGAPLGRELGLLRGACAALVSFLAASTDDNAGVLREARDISAQLANVRFSDIAPRDEEAEQHAREHLAEEEDEIGMEMQGGEEAAERRRMERLEDMMGGQADGGGCEEAAGAAGGADGGTGVGGAERAAAKDLHRPDRPVDRTCVTQRDGGRAIFPACIMSIHIYSAWRPASELRCPHPDNTTTMKFSTGIQETRNKDNMSTSEEPSFFEKERDRLAGEITAGFEELLSSSNVSNRKLEEILGMTTEYKHIAELWQSFQELTRQRREMAEQEDGPGLPGTGSHRVNEVN
ncbi:hypothetical protein NEOLEDRAFT_1145623 [Neolentinus lepideus HHB14362 ss-1]|uniref:Sensitive to high expression protein 9, mitochondrial n=1 Tax=Neolentinus lepideus HHB14362 ss-1 TaxID=1314782 RepID=A0A165UY94_9AGAM|nr:hypothetical protein NEOLEDRAFT_1145623 [Neolentinus lepideus HHB14362 ss-1]